MKKKLKTDHRFGSQFFFVAIFAISYLAKPYQTCLNVLARFCKKRGKKDDLKWTAGLQVSVFGHFNYTIPYQTIPNLSQCLN